MRTNEEMRAGLQQSRARLLEELQELPEDQRRNRVREIVQSWLLDGTYALLETLSRDLRSEFYMSWSVDGREPEFNRGRIHALNGFLNMLLGMASNMSEPDPDFGEDHLANPLIDEDMSRAGYLLP